MLRLMLIATLSFIVPLSAEVLNDSTYLHQHLATLRKAETEKASFKNSLKKIGEYLAIESMEELETSKEEVKTPLGTASHLLCKETPILVTILRAGLPLLDGVQEVFPDSEIGFFAMSRNEKTFVPEVSYIGMPDVRNKSVILVDTMVGTAGSANSAIEYLKNQGASKIIFLCVMITPEGFEKIAAFDPAVKVIAANVDPSMNEAKYIVPGLGDAGDRSYGSKSPHL